MVQKIPIVPVELWKKLYQSAERFYKLNAWKHFDDETIFAVQDSESALRGYGCIMGKYGETFGLCLYRGPEGFNAYRRICNNDFDFEQEHMLSLQNCLMAEFTDTRFLKKADMQIIQKLGLAFQGAHVWPMFRSYLPGYMPWHINEAEARFLTLALDCASDVAQKVATKTLDLTCQPGRCLTYFPKTTENTAPIETRWEPLPEYTPAPLPSYVPDQFKIASAKAPDNKKDSAWEADVFDMPGAILDANRPFVPKMTMVAHQKSGFVFHVSLITDKMEPQALGDAILEAIAKHKMLPDKIYFKNQALIKALEPLAKASGVPFEHKPCLQAIQDARQAFAQRKR